MGCCKLMLSFSLDTDKISFCSKTPFLSRLVHKIKSKGIYSSCGNSWLRVWQAFPSWVEVVPLVVLGGHIGVFSREVTHVYSGATC